ncbi:uncharacterized protein LOC129588722 [Paramacrobiotus metropolitanus]|uniref:uncharacterized protein LOC129588722 n=1 Tax=Paramacrobiotus metropolitanus TaxID=2943436 RepID=UPI00244639E7|nr:uncharacterized protein LOC129588722 [Paramacrobiotus metropolitanus]
MAASTSFAQLLDLAISSNDPGAVNFNILRRILGALLQETNLASQSAPIPLEHHATVTPTADQNLLRRVTRLETTLQSLLATPTNQELFDQGTGKTTPRRPVADLYHNLKLIGRIDALEGAVEKVASLVDDLITQVSRFEKNTEGLNGELQEALKKVNRLGVPDIPQAELATWQGILNALQGTDLKTIGEMAKRKHEDEVPAVKKQKIEEVPPAAQTAKELASPILQKLRVDVDGHETRLTEMKTAKADEKTVAERFKKAAADLAEQTRRIEQAAEEIKAVKAAHDELTASFQVFAEETRKAAPRKSSTFFSRSSVSSVPSKPSVPVAPGRSTQCALVAGETCPFGMHPDVHLPRMDTLGTDLEGLRQQYDKLQRFVDEQIIILAEKHHSLEADISDVIQMFKERRRPHLKVEQLDMHLVEKMLDDYDQVIVDMKNYDVIGKELLQKTDRLFLLCNELKRTKADNRLMKDSLDSKADVEEVREKVGKVAIEEFIRSSGAQITALSRQVERNEQIIKTEVGKLLETMSTRANRTSVDQLRSFVQNLTDTLEDKLAERNPVRSAAGTGYGALHCLSCGDTNVVASGRPDPVPAPAYHPTRDWYSQYNAFGRNVHPEEGDLMYRPRFDSIALRSTRTGRRVSRQRGYAEVIDRPFQELRGKGNVQSPKGGICAKGTVKNKR